MNKPQPVLTPGILYTAWDRYVCASIGCAGSTALHTGWTIGGAPVTPTTAEEVADWYAHPELGAMTCECGSVTAGPRGTKGEGQ